MRLGASMARRALSAASRPATARGGHDMLQDPPVYYHRSFPGNYQNSPFDFTQENYGVIQEILRKYPVNQKRSACLPLLHLAQRQHGGYIPLAAMNKISTVLGMSRRDVYECACFYSMYNRTKVGTYHLQFCITTPCMIMGIDEIADAVGKHLGIKMNETTPCGTITIGEMECMGACVNAPMFVVSDYSKAPHAFRYDYFEDLDLPNSIRIVDTIMAGKYDTLKVGSINRKTCENSAGNTTLIEPPRGPYCRDLDAVKAEIKKKEEAMKEAQSKQKQQASKA